MSFDGMRNELISSKFFNIAPRTGIEFGYKNIVFLRAGVGNFQKEKKFSFIENEDDIDNEVKIKTVTTFQINMGIGICIKNIATIDYAYSNLGNVSAALYSHIFSLKLALNSFKK
jgi:hypothetical protein